MSPSNKPPKASPTTVFNMSGQKVNRQVNIAGDATIHGDHAGAVESIPSSETQRRRASGSAVEPGQVVIQKARNVVVTGKVKTQNNSFGGKSRPKAG